MTLATTTSMSTTMVIAMDTVAHVAAADMSTIMKVITDTDAAWALN